jgi:voltage-gated potassium channel
VTAPPDGREADSDDERMAALVGLEAWLERPMLVLGLAWLALLVVELTRGLPPALEAVGTGIWVVFVADFALRLVLAPRKGAYLRRNWLTALSLVLPALRVLRVVRVLQVARAARAARVVGAAARGAGVGRVVRVVRVVGSVNRAMRALGRAFARRGFGYVVALTALVTLGGAAGMYAFERPGADGRGLATYGEALWWTAMLMTTMGSEYWPRSAEGRALCVLLALYAFAVFGYVTATLATYFVGRDAADSEAEVAGAADLAALRAELAALRRELAEGRAAGPGAPAADADANPER